MQKPTEDLDGPRRHCIARPSVLLLVVAKSVIANGIWATMTRLKSSRMNRRGWDAEESKKKLEAAGAKVELK